MVKKEQLDDSNFNFEVGDEDNKVQGNMALPQRSTLDDVKQAQQMMNLQKTQTNTSNELTETQKSSEKATPNIMRATADFANPVKNTSHNVGPFQEDDGAAQLRIGELNFDQLIGQQREVSSAMRGSIHQALAPEVVPRSLPVQQKNIELDNTFQSFSDQQPEAQRMTFDPKVLKQTSDEKNRTNKIDSGYLAPNRDSTATLENQQRDSHGHQRDSHGREQQSFISAIQRDKDASYILMNQTNTSMLQNSYMNASFLTP